MTGRVLVTGAVGLLGSQILRQTPPSVTVTAASFRRPMPAGFAGETHLIDLSDAVAAERLFDDKQYDVVINCAGASDVDRCEIDHDYALQTNVAIVRNLVAAAHKRRFRLITFSSDYVFDGDQGPYTETDQPGPINYYGQTKLMAEESIAAIAIDACVVRVCSLYATDPAAPKNLYRGIFDSLANSKVYRAADDLFSNPTEVTDLADAIWQLVTMPKLPRVLHLASPAYLSRYDLALLIAKKLGVDTKLIERVSLADLGLPAQRPRHAGLKSDLAYRILGRKLKSLAGIT